MRFLIAFSFVFLTAAISLILIDVGSYVTNYIFLVTVMTLLLVSLNGWTRLLAFYFLFYLSIGLLNISSWRGYIDPSFVLLVVMCVSVFFFFPLLLGKVSERKNTMYIHSQQLVVLIIKLHFILVMLAVLYIYAFYGNVLFNQHLRFSIPTSLEYVVKSALPVLPLIALLKVDKKPLYVLLLVLPAVLIGSRGGAVIAIISYVIAGFYLDAGKYKFREYIVKYNKYFIMCFLCILIIVTGFYLRRGGGSELAAVSVIMNIYFDYDNALIRLLLPFHLAFKETLGLANHIVIEGIYNYINPNALIWADIFTVLPGENLAAGQSLGRIFGTVEAGGLTPSLIGGIYIDFKEMVVLFFLFIGLVFFLLEKELRRSPMFIIVYSQVFVQFMHFFHRGFLKPEYITSILIAGFYYLLCHKLKL